MSGTASGTDTSTSSKVVGNGAYLAEGKEAFFASSFRIKLGHHPVSTEELWSLIDSLGGSSLQAEETKTSGLQGLIQSLAEALAIAATCSALRQCSKCNRCSRRSTLRVSDGSAQRAPADLRVERESPHDAAHTSSNDDTWSNTSSNRRTSLRSRLTNTDSLSSCDSECSHITEEDLPGQNITLQLKQNKRRPKRHVFRGDGVEINWLSPRSGRTGHHLRECKSPTLQETAKAAKRIDTDVAEKPRAQAEKQEAAREETLSRDAATATDEATSPGAAPAIPVARAGSSTLAGALEEIVARAEQVLAAHGRELQGCKTSLLRDIFLCLHAALKEGHVEQQKLERRQRRIERWLQQQQGEREAVEVQQQVAAKAAIALDARAAKGWANKVGSSLIGLRERGKGFDAAAAALPDATSATNKSDLPPVPPHPWHVAGRSTTPEPSTAASSISELETIYWRVWAGKQMKLTGMQPESQEQKHQQLSADYMPFAPLSGVVHHDRYLPLAALPAVTAARQKAANTGIDAQFHADLSKETQLQVPVGAASARSPSAATRRWKLRQFFSSDVPKRNLPGNVKRS